LSISQSLNSVLATALGTSVDGIYDTKLPDAYVLSAPVIVISSISDIPESAIDGPIVHREGRWQVSVRALDLTALRAVAAAVITALHGYSGGSVMYCGFEAAHGEFFETDVSPFQYHTPIDFMIQF
jgi:hypothetical protein